MRLLRPLDLRERMYSIAVAMIHLGVGTQVVVDYELALVLIGAIYLIPRSLFDLEAEKYQRVLAGSLAHLHWREFVGIAILMVTFFLLFPRFRVMSYVNPLNRMGRQQPEELDTASGGSQPGEQLLFRVEGEQINYLKQSALDTWDGRRWTKSTWMDVGRRNPWGNDTTDALHRTVKIMNYRLLDRTLPTDGHVLNVQGDFYQRLYIADHGGVMLTSRLRHNHTYDYWTILDDSTTYLNDRDRRRYTQVVPSSPAIQSWLDTQTRGLTQPDAIASSLVNYFQNNHEYEIGTPDLDRTDPIDDFILNRKSGHCERFASAMAVLLRMKGIPARVALGWVATERNDIGEFYNIRARHGHAWTEAWIEGRGWVIYDATPYGREFTMETRSFGLTVYEWVEYIWYSKIVEFSVSDQNTLVEFLGRQVQNGVNIIIGNLAAIALALAIGVLCWLGWRGRIWRHLKPPPLGRRQKAVVEARHFYGRMLRLLARQRHVRRRDQTPWEFLAVLETHGHPALPDIRQLTAWFCDIRYGQRELTPDLRRRIQQHLDRIAKPHKHPSPGHRPSAA